MADLKSGLDRYFGFYNRRRHHQFLDYATPNQTYADCVQNFEFQEEAV